MKSRAAVAFEAGKPLEIAEVEVGGARRRRSDGGNQGHGCLPHRRLHALR